MYIVCCIYVIGGTREEEVVCERGGSVPCMWHLGTTLFENSSTNELFMTNGKCEPLECRLEKDVGLADRRQPGSGTGSVQST